MCNVVQGWVEHGGETGLHVDITDDGSTDETYSVAYSIVNRIASLAPPKFASRLSASLHSNKTNQGLDPTLKEAYARALTRSARELAAIVADGERYTPIPWSQLPKSFVIKTDADNDFDQKKVMERLLPYAQPHTEPLEVIASPTVVGGVLYAAQVVAGVRWREILEHENPYEVWRRNDTVSILEREIGLKNLDPPSCGTQFYEAGALLKLLADKRIAQYDKRWGLDFIVPLVAQRIGLKTDVIPIENGSYDPERRPADKVGSQYDAYIENIASIVGKNPHEISETYRKTPSDMPH